jgi:hypothetical protein
MNVYKCIEAVPMNDFTVGKFYTGMIDSDGDVDFRSDDEGESCGITKKYVSKCFQLTKES